MFWSGGGPPPAGVPCTLWRQIHARACQHHHVLCQNDCFLVTLRSLPVPFRCHLPQSFLSARQRRSRLASEFTSATRLGTVLGTDHGTSCRCVSRCMLSVVMVPLHHQYWFLGSGSSLALAVLVLVSWGCSGTRQSASIRARRGVCQSGYRCCVVSVSGAEHLPACHTVSHESHRLTINGTAERELAFASVESQ